MSCRRRIVRVAVLTLVAGLTTSGSAVAAEVEGFTAAPIVSADRYHALGSHEYVMRFVARYPSESALIKRVVLPIERRPDTAPGPVDVRVGYWSDDDVDYWVSQWMGSGQVPESAIPEALGPGYGGGTVSVPIANSIPPGDGAVMTIVVSNVGGNPGDLVLGAADPADSYWNVAKSRAVGGQWSPLSGVFGLRYFVGDADAWPFDGFYAPVNPEPTVNVVNAGAAVPFKFSLGEDRGLAILAATPASQLVSCDGSAASDVLEETVAASQSGLSYDLLANRYQYVWKTEKEMAGTCRRFLLRLADGTTHSALFRMR